MMKTERFRVSHFGSHCTPSWVGRPSCELNTIQYILLKCEKNNQKQKSTLWVFAMQPTLPSHMTLSWLNSCYTMRDCTYLDPGSDRLRWYWFPVADACSYFIKWNSEKSFVEWGKQGDLLLQSSKETLQVIMFPHTVVEDPNWRCPQILCKLRIHPIPQDLISKTIIKR